MPNTGRSFPLLDGSPHRSPLRCWFVKVTLSTASILGNRAQYSPSLQARKPMLQFSPFSVATIVSIRNCGVKLSEA
ncbi:hypothetical protein HZ326_27511 [Fusarium oxysporum f. sp. albedinis]|nr:hypothetical protein HZ326_27511 [Fusarium oxysporum f. sp. albedinis]